MRDSLIEIWQANAAGRYRHDVDQHDAPLDPNFDGAGRCLTDSEGRYRFVTVKPGSYPWRNHPNAWRPAHIHFSLFGRAFTQRLVTQMYFPDDPLFPYDPIFDSIRDPKARERLISRFDLETTIPDGALGFRFDIVLRGDAVRGRGSTTSDRDHAVADGRAVPAHRARRGRADAPDGDVRIARARARRCRRARAGRAGRDLAAGADRLRSLRHARRRAFEFVAVKPAAAGGRRRTSRSASSRAAC